MIIYDGMKSDFLTDVENDTIAIEIEKRILEKMGRHTGESERMSWEHSLIQMYKVLNDDDIPLDAGVAIEYNLPQTAKRVDFIVSGYDEKDKSSAVIIELKQWSEITKVEATDAVIDAYVETFTGGAMRRVVHPSYQAWSYAQLIRDYNEYVQGGNVSLYPCAYLHNYLRSDSDPLDDKQYEEYTTDAPAFTKGQTKQLRDFIKKCIKRGDKKETIYFIDHGKIKPSKSLQESITSMIEGNKEFTMIDEQKIAYDMILNCAVMCQKDQKKRTIICHGGPGTGKSVIAVNLLVELTNRDQLVQYVSKNSAPRQVYVSKLKGKVKKTTVDNMFKGSGSYTEVGNNVINTLLVDDYEIIGLSQEAA